MKKELKTVENSLENSFKSDAIMEYVRTGDVSHMSDTQKNEIIVGMCKHLRIDPAMKPIDIIPSANGEKLYLNHTATDMIAQSHNLSRKLHDLEFMFDNTIALLRAEVTNGDRVETGFAAITIGRFEGGKLVPQRGEELANTLMKLQTKALRRATLAFCSAGVFGADYVRVEEKEAAQKIAEASKKYDDVVDAEEAETINIPEPAFISGEEVDAEMKEPEKPKKPKKPDSQKEKEEPAPEKEEPKKKRKVSSKPKKTKEEKEKEAAEKKEKLKQEKLDASKKLEEENKQEAEEIAEDFAIDDADFSIEEDEAAVETVVFDAKDQEHVEILKENLIDLCGEDWKSNKAIVKFITKEFMPKTHKKEEFIVKGTKIILPEFLTILRDGLPS